MAVGIWWTLDVYHENICTYCFSCKIFCKRVKWLIVFDFKHARCFINPRFADCLFIRKNVVITWKPVFFNMMQLRCCKPFFHSVFLGAFVAEASKPAAVLRAWPRKHWKDNMRTWVQELHNMCFQPMKACCIQGHEVPEKPNSYPAGNLHASVKAAKMSVCIQPEGSMPISFPAPVLELKTRIPYSGKCRL